MTKAEIAVEGIIKRIANDPRLAYLVGPMTQAYRDLTDAYAEIKGLDPDMFRQSFETGLQVQRLPARKDTPAPKSERPQQKKEQKRMATPTVEIEVPAGFRQNAKGHLVPEHMISEVDKLVDDQVNEIATRWKELQEQIAKFKVGTFGDLHAILASINEQYQVKKGGEKGNVQLITFSGRYKLLVAVNEVIGLGPEIQACIEKMKECAAVWTEGAKAEAKVIVDEFLASDGKGNYSVSKLLQIRRFKFPDPDWQLALKAMDDALRVIGSKQYLRLYEKSQDGTYVAIPLDIAAL